MSESQTAAAVEIAEEDILRAKWHGTLAALLARAPDDEQLAALGAMTGDDTEYGRAVTALSAVARATNAAAAAREYDALFIGVTSGELTPYGSFYLTGFLHEKPLARLRADLRAFGVERSDDVSEPEDHIAMLLETMSGLITGVYGAPADLGAQKRFFDGHIKPWAPKFFTDLEAAPSASLYMPLGALGRLFIDIEIEGFGMA